MAGVSQNARQDSGNSPILISPSKSIVEDSDHDSSVTEPTLISILAFRKEILAQFGDGLIDSDCDFDFGFYKGTKRIWVRNDHDFDELIQSLQTIL